MPKTCSTLFHLLFVDSLDVFFRNSFQNGATSWLPQELPEGVKVVITITKDDGRSGGDENGAEIERFLDMYASSDGNNGNNSNNGGNGGNTLDIGEIGHEVSMNIIRTWLEKVGRRLTNHQWRVVSNAMRRCSLPLFMSLCFEETKRWKSYTLEEQTVIPRYYREGGKANKRLNNQYQSNPIKQEADTYVCNLRTW